MWFGTVSHRRYSQCGRRAIISTGPGIRCYDTGTMNGRTDIDRIGTNRFNRHQSDRFKCVPSAWRKPKGIDNAVRRRFKGQIAMPSVRPLHTNSTRRTQLILFGVLDWLRQQQEDPPHDALGPQGLPRPQPQGRRAPPDAQPHLRC